LPAAAALRSCEAKRAVTVATAETVASRTLGILARCAGVLILDMTFELLHSCAAATRSFMRRDFTRSYAEVMATLRLFAACAETTSALLHDLPNFS
jgi:hypothetical protein